MFCFHYKVYCVSINTTAKAVVSITLDRHNKWWCLLTVKRTTALIVCAFLNQMHTFILDDCYNVLVKYAVFYILCNHNHKGKIPPRNYCLSESVRKIFDARIYCLLGSDSFSSFVAIPERKANNARRIVSNSSGVSSIIESKPLLSLSQYIIKRLRWCWNVFAPDYRFLLSCMGLDFYNQSHICPPSQENTLPFGKSICEAGCVASHQALSKSL